MPTEVWRKYPRRMLRHKTIVQAARVAFSISGIYDREEGESIAATPHAMMRYTMPVEEPVPAHSLIRRSTGEKA